MSTLQSLYATILEAIFPLSAAEKELLAYTPAQAYALLPKTPPLPIANALSVFAYKDERVEKLIWNIKYKKLGSSVKIAGYALWQTIDQGSPLVVIPMPITEKRRRERGFNQCELLADEIERLNTNGVLSVKKDVLIRVQHRSRQTLKGREERLAGAKGIFTVNENTTLPRNVRIVVIDDVITTGSTMKEALETLKRSGFENVSGLSLAH